MRPGEWVPVLDPMRGDTSAIFVAQTEHPIWPHLRLVIWKMSDGSWSHDALSAGQDVGEPVPTSTLDRASNLRLALLGSP